MWTEDVLDVLENDIVSVFFRSSSVISLSSWCMVDRWEMNETLNLLNTNVSMIKCAVSAIYLLKVIKSLGNIQQDKLTSAICLLQRLKLSLQMHHTLDQCRWTFTAVVFTNTSHFAVSTNSGWWEKSTETPNGVGKVRRHLAFTTYKMIVYICGLWGGEKKT